MTVRESTLHGLVQQTEDVLEVLSVGEEATYFRRLRELASLVLPPPAPPAAPFDWVLRRNTYDRAPLMLTFEAHEPNDALQHVDCHFETYQWAVTHRRRSQRPHFVRVSARSSGSLSLHGVRLPEVAPAA